MPEVRDLLGHSTIKMTERYAHLALDNLPKIVGALENRSRSGHVGSSDLNNDDCGGVVSNCSKKEKWWARKDSNLRLMDYESCFVGINTLNNQ